VPASAAHLPAVLAAIRDDFLPALLMGGGLVLLGGWFIKLHLSAWRRHAADASLAPDEREHYRRQFRRRMQASGIILVIGLMLPIGDSLIPWRRGDASIATLYWLFVLALTCWVLLLAIGDLVSSRSQARVSLSRLRGRQRELQAEADRLRAEHRDRPRRD
jgi:hypothetical protein